MLLKIKASSVFYTAFRTVKFRTRNPREPHFDRKRMIEVCKPLILPKTLPDYETCLHSTPLQPDENNVHPYHKILCKELQMNWEASPIKLFYHLNSVKVAQKREISNMFFKKDLFLHFYPLEVLRLYLESTSFKSVLDLFHSPLNSALIFGSKTSLLNEALKLNKKTNNIIMLSGIVDNVFYSVKQLQDISKLNQESLHVELVHNLNYLSSKTSSALSHHMDVLSMYLRELSNNKS